MKLMTNDPARADALYEAYLLGKCPEEGAVTLAGAVILLGRAPALPPAPELAALPIPLCGNDSPKTRLAAKSLLEWRRPPAGTAVILSAEGIRVTESAPDISDAEDYTPPDALAAVMTAAEAAAAYGRKAKDITADCEAGLFGAGAMKDPAGTFLLTRAAADARYGEGKIKEMCPHPFLLAFTTAEAARLWGRDAGTVRAAAAGAGHAAARLGDGERRHAGRVWLVSRAAMEKLYGQIRAELWRERTAALRIESSAAF